MTGGRAAAWGRILARRPEAPTILWVLRTYGFTEGRPCRCTDRRCTGRTIPATGRRQADGTWVEFCRGGTAQVWHDHHLERVDNRLDLEAERLEVTRLE